MNLSKLEEDLAGDLAQDDHGLHEIFQFARLHHPDASDDEVYRIAMDVIVSWANRGWLDATNAEGQPICMDVLISCAKEIGRGVVDSYVGIPKVLLSAAGRDAIGWLR